MGPHIPQKDNWDKAKIISGVFSGLLVPLLILFFGFYFNSTLKTLEMDAEYLKIATDIIKNSDTSLVDIELKKWAINILKSNNINTMPPVLEADLLGVEIVRPLYQDVSGLGFLLYFDTIPYEHVYVYVNDIPKILTPGTIEVFSGHQYKIEWKSNAGEILKVFNYKYEDSDGRGQKMVLNLNKKTIHKTEISYTDLEWYIRDLRRENYQPESVNVTKVRLVPVKPDTSLSK